MSTIYSLADLSFPDQSVSSMRIDHDAKCVSISMTGACVADSIGAGELSIYGWETLHQRRFEMAHESWCDIPKGQEELLKDIAEFIADENQIVVRGFGAITGQWIELAVRGGRGEYRTRD